MISTQLSAKSAKKPPMYLVMTGSYNRVQNSDKENKIMKTKNKPSIPITPVSIVHYILAAVIPTVIGILLFKHRQIAPFGGKSVLCMDLWGQYFSMYINNKSADSISELFHSWNGALGFNNWTQSAYYCNSIFVILLRMFPYASLVKVLDIFCLVKIAISSMTCLGMLRFKSKTASPVLIGGAVSYSLCSYMIAYISQFMWTDLMMYAPLIVVGIDLLIEKKKPLLYVIFLALSIFTSFYIGFAVCIFSTIYFLTRIFLQMHIVKLTVKEDGEEKTKIHIAGIKDTLFSGLRFAFYSLISGALSAFIIIPVALGISQTLAIDAPAPEKLEWYGNFTGILQLCLPYCEFFQEYRAANLFCGILVFLAVPLYFANKSFRKAERIASGVLLVFLVASLNCNILNYIWHGFHFPNQLPGRWTFIFSLYLILLGSIGIARYEGLTPVRAGVGSAVGLILLFLTQKGLGDQESYDVPAYGIVIVIVAAVLVLAASFLRFTAKDDEGKKKKSVTFSHVAAAVIAAMMCFDMGESLLTVCDYEGNKGFQASDEETYTAQIVRHSTNGARIKSGKDDFYRVEDNTGFTFNPTMIDNCKGMSYYSSTMNGNAFNLFKYMGNRVYADKVSSVYNISSPVQNSLFGIKYFLDYANNIGWVLPGTVIQEEGNEDNSIVPIRWNTTALPIAYAVSDDILKFEVDNQIRGLDNHMALLSAMLGQEAKPYIEFAPDSVEPINCDMQDNEDLDQQYFFTHEGQSEVTINYTYTAPKYGFYFFSHNFRAGSIHITAPNLDRTYNPNSGAFGFCGCLNEGDVIKVEFTISDISIGCHGMKMYYMDEGIWDSNFRTLAAGGLDVTYADGTRIEGDVELSENRLMLMTAVQDGGWEIYCDGKEVTSQTALDVFPCFRIPSGKHHIVMKYHVPGFRAGCIIAFFGLLGLIIPFILKKKNILSSITDDDNKGIDKTEDEEHEDDSDEDTSEDNEDDDSEDEPDDETEDSEEEDPEEDDSEETEEAPEAESEKPAPKKKASGNKKSKNK